MNHVVFHIVFIVLAIKSMLISEWYTFAYSIFSHLFLWASARSSGYWPPWWATLTPKRLEKNAFALACFWMIFEDGHINFGIKNHMLQRNREWSSSSPMVFSILGSFFVVQSSCLLLRGLPLWHAEAEGRGGIREDDGGWTGAGTFSPVLNGQMVSLTGELWTTVLFFEWII